MIPTLLAWITRRKDPATIQARADKAQQWLKDDTLNMALSVMRERAMARWLTAQDLETREACWRAMQDINGFVAALQSLMADAAIQKAAERKRA